MGKGLTYAPHGPRPTARPGAAAGTATRHARARGPGQAQAARRQPPARPARRPFGRPHLHPCLHRARAADKIAKHAAGCDLLERDFIPFVVTTETFGRGVGAAAIRDFVRSMYVARAARLIASGATGAVAAREFFDLQCRI